MIDINPLLKGGEPAKRFDYIMKHFLKLRSEEMIEALRQVYVDGVDEEIVRLTVDAGNYNRANKKLIKKVQELEKFKEMDLQTAKLSTVVMNNG